MLRTLTFALLLLTVIPSLQAATGFRQVTINASGERPLTLSLWYPAQAKDGLRAVGENAVFYGIQAIPEAPIKSGRHPLLLLSHGYGGNWRNLSWLAADLVQQGYIVAAPDHPGTTTTDRTPAQAARLWLRPDDVTQVLNYLLAAPGLAEKVDDTRIAAIGHSLGGWTVMALAGARFSPAQLRADCKKPVSQNVCGLIPELGLNRSEADTRFASALTDKRIKAVVALDAGLTRGFTRASLQQVSIPVLILAAGQNIADLPARYESGQLADSLPTALVHYEIIHGVSHFSFMQLCKAGAEDKINQAAPGEGIVCRDGAQRSRQAIHQAIEKSVTAFLAQTL